MGCNTKTKSCKTLETLALQKLMKIHICFHITHSYMIYEHFSIRVALYQKLCDQRLNTLQYYGHIQHPKSIEYCHQEWNQHSRAKKHIEITSIRIEMFHHRIKMLKKCPLQPNKAISVTEGLKHWGFSCNLSHSCIIWQIFGVSSGLKCWKLSVDPGPLLQQ